MNEFAKTWICEISPTTMDRFEKNKEDSMKCDIIWNGDSGFEVQDGPYGHTFDLKKGRVHMSILAAEGNTLSICYFSFVSQKYGSFKVYLQVVS